MYVLNEGLFEQIDGIADGIGGYPANGKIGLKEMKVLTNGAYGYPRDLLGAFRLALKYCNTDGQDGLTWAEVQQCAVKRIKINHSFQMKMDIFLTFLFH